MAYKEKVSSHLLAVNIIKRCGMELFNDFCSSTVIEIKC